MIIPVKCFTCGKVLANKYQYYQREVRKRKITLDLPLGGVIYFTDATLRKTPEALVLDELGLDKICCRRHMLTHVDIL